MSLSITGMNMPRCCADCDLLYDYMSCSVTGTRADFEKMDSERLPNCPLKEIIDNTETVEKSELWEVGFADGLAIGTKWAERPKGEWINHRNDYGHNIADCSFCGKTMQWHDEDEDGIPRYCWYCGAAMKGVAE